MHQINWNGWAGFFIGKCGPSACKEQCDSKYQISRLETRWPPEKPCGTLSTVTLVIRSVLPFSSTLLVLPFSSNITQAPPSAPATGAFFRTGPITEDSSGSSRTTQLRAIHPSPSASARSCPQRQSWRLLDGFWWEFAFQRLPSQGAATHEGLSWSLITPDLFHSTQPLE